MESIFKVQDDEREVIVEGSFVNFHESNQQFSSVPNQGFVESIDSESQELSIRCISGKIIKQVSIHRVYL